jgi:hypothetical protein
VFGVQENPIDVLDVYHQMLAGGLRVNLIVVVILLLGHRSSSRACLCITSIIAVLSEPR